MITDIKTTVAFSIYTNNSPMRLRIENTQGVPVWYAWAKAGFACMDQGDAVTLEAEFQLRTPHTSHGGKSVDERIGEAYAQGFKQGMAVSRRDSPPSNPAPDPLPGASNKGE